MKKRTNDDKVQKKADEKKLHLAKWQKIFVIIVLTLIIVLLCIAVAFFAMRTSGKRRLYASVKNEMPDMQGFYTMTDEQTKEEKESETESISSDNKPSDETETVGEDEDESVSVTEQDDQDTDGYVYKDGDIEYNGHVYRYNSDILTFLVLGIDSNYPVPEVSDNTDYLKGGQSDAIFLAVMNPHDRSISIVAINRNSMVDIDIYDSNNNYVRTAKSQICVQHGYGDGREMSCERAKKVVSKLMYNLPIHRYLSMRLGAISVLNDAMGGVEVTLPTDFPELNMTAGTTVRLNGEQAFMFLKFRNQYQFDSATNRLNNDKVYLSAFMNQVFDQTKSDVTFPLKLYDMVKEYILTDISIDEMSYLASELLGYSVKEARMYSVPGQTVMGNKFEEFYVDEYALREQILNIFYEIVR